jgi:Fe-S cluster assembly protein SufD
MSTPRMSPPIPDWRNERFAATKQALDHTGNTQWQAIRERAFSRFGELGFPSSRNEDWKYTSVKQIASTRWSPAETAIAALPEQLGPLLAIDAPRIVFVGGRFAPELSSIADLPAGLTLTTLATALAEGAALPSQLAQHADFETDSFTALNTAFHQDAAVLTVAPDTVVEQAVQLIFVAPESGTPVEHHPRTLIVAHHGSALTVIESHVGTGGQSFSNAVTELHVEEGATLRRIELQLPSAESRHIGSTVARLEKDSHFHGHTFTLSGALVRNSLRLELAGEGADCTLDGLSVGSDEQHIDNHLFIHHAVPHCTSDQFYRTMLADRSRGVFSGNVLVGVDAQRTAAQQSSRSLLLSDQAEADNRPQLEIHADDVRCTHGATVGQLDDEALFYLRSRGLDQATAKMLLTGAFCGEVVNRLPDTPFRAALAALVSERLQQINI